MHNKAVRPMYNLSHAHLHFVMHYYLFHPLFLLACSLGVNSKKCISDCNKDLQDLRLWPDKRCVQG